MTHDAFGTYAVHYGDPEFLDDLQTLPITIPILSALGLYLLHIPNLKRTQYLF